MSCCFQPCCFNSHARFRLPSSQSSCVVCLFIPPGLAGLVPHAEVSKSLSEKSLRLGSSRTPIMEGRLHLLAGQALGHQPTHGYVNPGLARLWQVFVVLREPAVPRKPSKRPFHDPTVWQDMEATGQRRRLLPRRNPDVAHQESGSRLTTSTLQPKVTFTHSSNFPW
jgi:hypothetical protein